MAATTSQLEDWNSPSAVSEYLGVKEATLAQWRHRGIGPEYARMGKHVRYAGSAVKAWASDQTVRTAR